MATESILVLMYHRIGDAHNDWESKYCVSPERFAAQMNALASRGMHAVDIDDFVAWLDGQQPLPKGGFVLTFDDGFRGVREHALHVLERHGWPATVFLVTDLIGKQDEWTQQDNPDGVTYPLLDSDDIADMARRGIKFHSHTCGHPSLPKLDDARLMDELVRSRAALRDRFGFESTFLAYPFGHTDERVERAARAAGFAAGFSTQPGFNRRDVNRFRIRRLDVFGTDTPQALLRKMHYGTNDGSLRHVMRYYWGRVASRLGVARR